MPIPGREFWYFRNQERAHTAEMMPYKNLIFIKLTRKRKIFLSGKRIFHFLFFSHFTFGDAYSIAGGGK